MDRQTCIHFSGVSSAFSCDRLFNLVSLYGRVRRIRVDSDAKTARVDMGRREDAERVVEMLNNTPAFLRTLRCQIDENGDDVRSYSADCHYDSSPLNRFNGKHVCKPSRQLIFFDTPPSIEKSLAALTSLIERRGCPPAEMPCKISFIKDRVGLIMFPNMQVAVECIAACSNVDERGNAARHDRSQRRDNLLLLNFAEIRR